MSVPEVTFFDIRQSMTTLALPILFLFFLAILVPTNGVGGSGGIILVLIWVLWRESELRNRWWTVVWPWLFVVLVYFVIMSTYAFSRVTALRDGIEVLKGVALSVVALYVLQLPELVLRKSLEYVTAVLLIITIGIVIYNFHLHDLNYFLNNQEFDWYVNRNRLAVGFSITSIFLATLMVGENSRLKSFSLSIVWAFVGVTALLNGSRGAVAATVVATAAIVLSALPRLGCRKVFRFELWLFPMLMLCGLIGLFFYRHISLNKFFIHDGKGIDTGRFGIWQAVSERVVQSPWFGYGPHGMKYDHMIEPSRVLSQDHPHSIYLGLIYASGFIGALFWLIWFSTFSFKIRQSFFARNDLSYYLGIGLLANILAHGFVDFDFYMFAVFTYIIVGLVMILPEVSYTEQ